MLSLMRRRPKEELSEIASRSLIVHEGAVPAPVIPAEVIEILNTPSFPFDAVAVKALEKKFKPPEPKKAPELPYPRIDMNFLSMEGRKGWPRFGIYTLDESKCIFGATIVFDESALSAPRLIYNFPRPLAEPFSPFFAKAAQAAYDAAMPLARVSRSEVTVSAPFNGIVPVPIKTLIRETREKRTFDDLVIVAEAPEWEVQARVIQMPVSPDPLVIGIKNGFTYLIERFDVTSIEAIVAREFAT